MANLRRVLSTIAKINPPAARALLQEIQAQTEALRLQPLLYPVSTRHPQLRAMVVRKNYMVYYRPMKGRIVVVNVMHARRQFPRRPYFEGPH